jgi:very-short-patch-repair endonuclease
MAYPRQKIGVEYDGAVHVGDRRQMEIDAARRRDLQDEGWMIITVTASQLRDPRRLAQSVEAALVVRRRTSRI